MAASLRAIGLARHGPLGPAVLLALACGLPLGWAAALAIGAGWDARAWRDLLADPQCWRALTLTLGTGLVSTLLAWLAAALLLSMRFPGPHWSRLVRGLSPMLAVPHAAFAIGLLFLLSPSGWLLRLLSPWATGFDMPPPWITTQDPWGMGLVAVLVAKEVPFLLWAAAAQLQRPDVGQRLTRELQSARSMGYAPRRAWWLIVWPQLWQRLWAPTLAVLAYSLTVVDMALIIGPTSPPTLSVLAWQWLVDADPAVNAQGAAAAWLLAAVVAACALCLWVLRARIGRMNRLTGPRPAGLPRRHGLPWLWVKPGQYLLPGAYVAVMLALAVGSVSGVWPFPQLLPQSWTWQAWASVGQSSATLGVTMGLGLVSALTALAWSIAWLEWAPAHWDRRVRQLVYLPLLLPSVLWVLGMHRLTVSWGLDARLSGLWLAHTLAALPYVLIALTPAYTGFDARYAALAASLGQGRWHFLLRVKWPLLKAALASALALGFAVSCAQYLPTLFVGAGRFSTVTTEAVTLASGAQRSLTAAYAWLQWLLPVVVFGLAALAGRPRRFAARKGRL